MMTSRLMRWTVFLAISMAPMLATAAQQAKLVELAPGTQQNGDLFGSVVAVQGDVAVVGVPFDDLNGTDVGGVYVFRRTGGVGSLEERIAVSVVTTQARFGWHVAIDGTTIVVGIPFANNPGANASGAVEVFVYDGVGPVLWEFQQRLIDTAPVLNDHFGESVAVAGDYLVVGTPGEGTQGAASFFNRSGTTWTLMNTVAGNSSSAANFGIASAISGTTAVVGDSLNDNVASNAGGARVFVESGGVFVEQGGGLASLIPGSGLPALAAADQMGRSVAISGDTIAVGTHRDNAFATTGGSIHVFTRTAGVWSFSQQLSISGIMNDTRLGTSVGLDGDVLVAGGAFHDLPGNEAGLAGIYRRPGFGSPFVQIVPSLQSSDIQTGDRFGSSIDVSASGGGDTVIMGAPNEDGTGSDFGAAYVFVELAPTPSPTPSPTASPSPSPTESPTASPTESPTASPTESPTASPTPSPTESPTVSPTASPTLSPTESPTPPPTASPTASPTLSPSPTESPTVSPTASPTASPTPSPTPTATPDLAALILGYFPTNDNGRGTAFFQDNNAYPARNNHRMNLRDGSGALIAQSDYPSAGAAGEARSMSPILPLEAPGFHFRSWETGIRVQVLARNGTTTLYQKTYLGPGGGNLRHMSAQLTDLSFDNYIAVTDPPGTYPATFTDQRPTGQSNHYAYDVFRRNFQPTTTSQVAQTNHGIAGTYNETVDHPPINKAINLPVLAGQQIFWLRPRQSYDNSAGTNLGRYDVAPKSPNLSVETTATE